MEVNLSKMSNFAAVLLNSFSRKVGKFMETRISIPILYPAFLINVKIRARVSIFLQL